MRLTLALVMLSACALPDPEGNVDWQAIFAPDRLAEWRIAFAPEDWHRLTNGESTEYVPADLEVDGVAYGTVGIRLTGNPNRSKFGMRVRFNEYNPALRFHGVKRVNLRNSAGDPSLVREALALSLMRAAGVPAPRSSFVWVSWGTGGGVYTLVQQVDKRFLEDRFDEDDGNLYKVGLGGNLVYGGDDADRYDWASTYVLKTNELEADHRALIGLMEVLDRSGADLEDALPRILDVDGALTMLAVNSWLANMSSYAGTAENYYLYRDEGGRFHMIPWDLERAFGNFHGEHCCTAAGEQLCTRLSHEALSPQHTAAASYYVAADAESCAEQPAEFCQETQSTCEPQPLYCDSCSYSTDEQRLLDPFNPTGSLDRPLLHALMTAFGDRYREILRSLVDGPLMPTRVEAEALRMAALIAERARQDVGRDPAHSWDGASLTPEATLYEDSSDDAERTVHNWASRVPGLIPFATDRDATIRQILGDWQ